MTEPPKSTQDYFELFDRSLEPDRTGAVAAAPLRADSPEAHLRAMIERPDAWPDAGVHLKAEALWADASGLGPLELPELTVLGRLLARDLGRFGARVDSSIAAASLWYRSAVVRELESDCPLRPLDLWRAALAPTAGRAAAEKAALTLGFRLEQAYELAVPSVAAPQPAGLERVRQTHGAVLQELLWPELADADAGAAYRLVLSAWVATGDAGLLAAGLLALLDTTSARRLDLLRALLTPPALALALCAVRRGQAAGSPRARANLAHLANQAARAGGGECRDGDRAELFQGVVEMMSLPGSPASCRIPADRTGPTGRSP